MIDLYDWPTPNGHEITMFLEEAGLDYTIHPVNALTVSRRKSIAKVATDCGFLTQ